MKFDDLVITPSEEAEICLTCEKKRCYPGNCERYAKEIKKIKRDKESEGRNEL